MKIILEIICWKTWLFCKPNLFLKLNYCVDSKAFRISLCWQSTYLHNLAWTFLRYIHWIIFVYETPKICNLIDTPCAFFTLVFIQESMNRVHDLIVKLRNCELTFKVYFHIIDTPVLPNQQASTFFLRLLYWTD